MTRALLAVALLFLASCASAWPAVCKDSLSGVRCDCRTVRFVVAPAADGKPYPAGRVLVGCNGDPLPFVVDADDVTTAGKP